MSSPGSKAVLLLLDSSLQGVSMGLMSVAASREDATPPLLWSESHLAVMGSAQAVSNLLRQGLAACDRQLADIAGVMVANGPGTFTGIRIGLAFAAGLTAGLAGEAGALPVRGVSALAAVNSWRTTQRRGQLSASASMRALLLPATKTHGYIAFCSATGEQKAEGIFDLEVPHFGQGFSQALKAAQQSGICFETFGDWPLATQRLTSAGYEVTRIEPSEVCRDAIYGMAVEVTKHWPHGFSLEAIEPRYLRLSTAEERLQANRS